MSPGGKHGLTDYLKLLKKATDSKYLLPVLLFSVSFVWKLLFITHRDLCIDEPFTLFNAQKSVSDIVRLTVEGEPNPPLFMLLMHFWIQCSGIGIAAVRLLPLLFNSLSAAVIFVTGRRFFGLPAALIASGLFLVSNFQFFHALEVRTYSLLTLTTAGSLYFYLRLLNEPGKKSLIIALVLTNTALVHTHYFGWLVLLMQLAGLALYYQNKAAIKSVLISTGFTALGYLPFFMILYRQFLKSSKGTWVAPPDSGLQYLYQIDQLLNHREVVNAILWIFVIGVLYTTYSRKWKTVKKEVILLFIWWFVPFTLMFIVSYKIPVFITRYLLFNSVGMYLFVVAAVVSLLQNNKILTPLAGIVLIAMMGNRMRILPDDFSYREFRNSTEFVRSNYKNGDVIILYPYWTDTGFAYYFNQAVFKDYRNFYQRLKHEHIFPVWGIDMVKYVVEQRRPARIIYYLNGPEKGGDDGIGAYLISHYRAADSAFFPQTIAVTIFKRQ